MLKIIEKEDKYLDTHTCPVCQKTPLDKDGVLLPSSKSCEHLIYVATGDGVEIDKEGFYNEDDNDGVGTEWEDITNKLDDNYVGFVFYIPAPSGFSSYWIYKKTIKGELNIC